MAIEITSKMRIPTQKIEVTTLKEVAVIFRGNQTKMAEELGFNRGTLSRKLAEDKVHYVKIEKDGTGVKLTYINK